MNKTIRELLCKYAQEYKYDTDGNVCKHKDTGEPIRTGRVTIRSLIDALLWGVIIGGAVSMLIILIGSFTYSISTMIWDSMTTVWDQALPMKYELISYGIIGGIGLVLSYIIVKLSLLLHVVLKWIAEREITRCPFEQQDQDTTDGLNNIKVEPERRNK